MNNKRIKERSEISKEVGNLHPDLQKFIGRDGVEIPPAKMDQFRRTDSTIKSIRTSESIIPLWLKWNSRAVAAVLVLLIGVGSILLMQKNDGLRNFNEVADHLVMLEYLIEEAEYMDGDFLIDEIGTFYLESLELDKLGEDDELYFRDSYFNTSDLSGQEFYN
ncbi:MAG: hypothetical protein EA409_07650 [Saprospirales bacterium]|nr:MAG: hypothetical protein EA409_07650 [Saprospirales bacterium]